MQFILDYIKNHNKNCDNIYNFLEIKIMCNIGGDFIIIVHNDDDQDGPFFVGAGNTFEDAVAAISAQILEAQS